jgi:prepilin-type N-terminal cleavage/methylation domain-containing protein
MNRKGITLIELLVALCVSGILVAGVYKTFISQQHTLRVQEQVVDMQQNVRLSITQMTRELRMAGFGGGGADGWYKSAPVGTEFFKHGAIYGLYTAVVNPDLGGTSVTVLEGYEPLVRTTLSVTANTNDQTIFVNDVSGFDEPPKPKIYISINGTEAHHIQAIDPIAKTITFPGWDKKTHHHNRGLRAVHQVGEPVYLIAAVTYSIGMFDGKRCLLRDDHLGSGPQPVAENIESLQFAYFDKNGNPTAAPEDIRMIQVTVSAIPDQADKDLTNSRRKVTTNLQLRNLLF